MSAEQVAADRGRTGYARPGKQWRRHDIVALRIGRLARDVANERDRQPNDGTVYRLLDAAAAVLEDAARVADPD